MNKKCRNLFGMCFIFICLTGCFEKKNSETNYFGGQGELQYEERLNGRNAIYDDENIYFNAYYNMNAVSVKLDQMNHLSIDCDNAACNHDNIDCKAYIGDDAEYFMYNDKLYLAKNESTEEEGNIIKYGKIIDCESEKVVFGNPIPGELDKEKAVDDGTELYYVRVLEENILKVEGRRHAYLLNEEFEVIYWHDDVGKFPWGCIYENRYYYVNDLYELVCVHLDTKEKEILDLKDKIFAGDMEGDFIYYSTEFKELYKYSLIDGTAVKLLENCLFFSVYDGYIYCQQSVRGEESKKIIIDANGTFVNDYTSCKNMGVDDILKIKDKMYTWFDGGIAEMDANGENYKEYALE